MKNENKKENGFASLKGYQKAMPIIFVAFAIFTAVCVFSKESGFLGEGIGNLLRGLFSIGGYLIPFLFGIHAVCYVSDVSHKRFVPRIFFSLTAVILASAVEYAICLWGTDAVFSPVEFYNSGVNGGFVGSVLGFALMKMVGHVGVLVFSGAVLAIYAIFFYADRTGEFGQKALDITGATFGFLAKTEGNVKKRIADKKQEKADRAEEEHRNKSDDLLNDSFFSGSGIENVRIDELGIGTDQTEELEPQEAEPTPPRRRRNADTPIDLGYETEVLATAQGEPEAPPIAPSSEEAPESGDLFGIEDSAEKVFTKNFDPFDFATEEKIAAKPSSKATIEEELDDMTMLELRGEPSDKEKRMMELERRKKIWLERNKKVNEGKEETPASQDAATITVNEARNEPAPSPASDTVTASAPTAAQSPAAPVATIGSDPDGEVNTYTSYSSTKTTYTQPIKTVEFTINGVSAHAPSGIAQAPIPESTNDTPLGVDKSTEDVAAIIAAKIARENPAYARSANEMITYTKVTPSPSDVFTEAQPALDTATFSNGTEAQQLDETSAPKEMLFEEERDTENEPSRDLAAESFTAPSVSYPAVAQDSYDREEIVFESMADENTGINQSKETYERAAGFISGITAEDSSVTPQYDNAPEFKPYEPTTVPGVSSVTEGLPTEETLKVERSMLSPSVSMLTESVPLEADDPEPIIPQPDFMQSDESESVISQPEEEEFASTPATVNENNTPQYTVVDENTAWGDDAEATALQNSEEKIDWEADAPTTEETGTDTEASDEEIISFKEEYLDEDSEEEEEDSVSDAFDEAEDDDIAPEEIPPEEQNPDVIKMREMFPFLNPIGEEPPKSQAENVTETVTEETDDEAPPFDDPIVKKPAAEVSLVPAESAKEEEKKPKKPDYSNYEFPSIELLAKDDVSADENIQAEIQENADKLIETLGSFGVTASIKGVDRGPRITRYEVVPAKGVKVSSILNLQDDIALNLAAGSLRMEAPIPGKSAVGIEIPNKKSSTVRLRNLLETEEFISSKSKTAVCIGRDVAGQPVFGDIAKMPHLLIAGATGMGKSVCINALMISILYKARPDEVKFIMIDPKQVEFTMYNGIPHLLVPVVSDAKQAAGALMWAVEEMERRYNLLNPLCVRNIEAYNEKVTADPSLGEPMSKIVIVIDEFADLMLQVKDPVETLVMRIAQKARAAGIYLVIGTQRPSVNVITGIIKANVPSRISCKVMSNVDSKTVLDSAGAEKLLDRGDMLYAPTGSPKPNRVQGAFVADSEVEAIMAHLKKFSDGSNYDSNVMEEIERAAQKCSKKGGGNNSDYDDGGDEIHGEGYLNDRQFLDAVEVAVNTRKISTSLIQRKLSIGYGKAAKFIDTMEDMGIVGEANGQRPREVLITPDEWREKLARATLD